MALFERFERELVAEGHEPISLSRRRGELEAIALRQWAAGQPAYLAQEVERVTGRPERAS
jgi:hypothetical protein